MTDAPPKLFISYSWTSEEHEQWVMELAEKLRGSGVDVILDKWELKAGHDVIAFMEEMVANPAIDKVIMVVDKSYAEKANARTGGVGIETEIIAPQIYNQQKQTKFAAIAMEKDTEGKLILPIYCQSRMCIDFSEHKNPDNYDKSFINLRLWIFDLSKHEKPPIGKQSAFLSEKPTTVTPAITPYLRAIEAIKEGKGNISGHVADYLETLSVGMKSFTIKEYRGEFDDAVIESIESFLPYRAEFIELILTMAKYGLAENCTDALHKFFEKLIPYLHLPKGFSGSYMKTDQDNFKFIIHELFLYTIAILLKAENFDAVHDLISNDYYVESYIKQDGDQMVSYTHFYNHLASIKERNNRSERSYISLHTNLLEERAENLSINFQHIMQADLVLFMRKEIELSGRGNRWWPMTLAHTSWSYHGVFEIFARSKSRKYFDKIMPLLGITRKDDMMPLFNIYASNKRILPSWEGDTLNPESLINFDNLATTP